MASTHADTVPPRALWPAILVAATGLLAVLAAAIAGLPVWARAITIALIIVATGWHVHRLFRPRWCRLRLHGRRLTLQGRAGERRSGRIVSRPFVSPLYLGFRLHADSGRRPPRAIGVFRGQVDAESFRRLACRLRRIAGTR